ncbi:MAG: hypothetical protein AB8G22_21715 [Saprospiraceae bacterium]
MITDLRQSYNSKFTSEKYQTMLDDIAEIYGHRAPFRIAETPVFVSSALRDRIFTAIEDITETLIRPDFKELSKSAVQAGQSVPNETDHTTFLQMDFGICLDENGEMTPQLIEVQGFPSLYFYQEAAAQAYAKHFELPKGYDHLFHGQDPKSYIERLRKIIVGDCDPKNVVLLEIEPKKQATAIDFYVCRELIDVPFICISEVIKEDKKLFYKDESGEKIRIERIFNRVIFDELITRDDLQRQFNMTEDADVEWIGHPNWFFRISKHTLPLLDSQYVPKSYFLNELENYPEDLHNYVLKPLYSFAGSGVLLNINPHDLDAIKDPENYILQRKVTYAPILETPTGKAVVELRMLMLWEKDAPRPELVNNLARISKGEMIGVRYNKNKDWVGGSIGYFEV